MDTPEKKPRTKADSLAGIRVATDDEIRAAAKAEIARIRAEIAQQKKVEQAATETTSEVAAPTAPAPTPAPKRTTEPKAEPAPKTEKPTVGPRRRTHAEAAPIPAPIEKKQRATSPVPATEVPVSEVAQVVAEGQAARDTLPTAPAAPAVPIKSAKEPRITLTSRIRSLIPAKPVASEHNIKKWEPSPEEAVLLRARKIRRLRVAVITSGISFVAMLTVVIYLATGGLVQPTQGVTTEWGTASQVTTLVDKMATPRAGNHVIVNLPGTQNKNALVLGFLQGFDGKDYLVTIGEETIIVPQSDVVGTVTAIWPG